MITVLAGGTGAAKFIRGLIEIVPQDELTIIVNTSDDDWIYGLYVSPDLDTIMYLLAGLLDEERGWGIKGDTFNALRAMERYGEQTWFRIGDQDLVTHVKRSFWIIEERLELLEITQQLCQSLNVRARLLPAPESFAPTRIHTPDGVLTFQEFFVRERCAPEVVEVEYECIEEAKPTPGVLDAIRASEAIIVAPSNPITSIAPMLGVAGIRQALWDTPAPIAAISPIIGGQAVGGPAGKLMAACGHEVSASGVAHIYADFVDVFIIDEQDAALRPDIEQMGLRVVTAHTLMSDVAAKVNLAEITLRELRESARI